MGMEVRSRARPTRRRRRRHARWWRSKEDPIGDPMPERGRDGIGMASERCRSRGGTVPHVMVLIGDPMTMAMTTTTTTTASSSGTDTGLDLIELNRMESNRAEPNPAELNRRPGTRLRLGPVPENPPLSSQCPRPRTPAGPGQSRSRRFFAFSVLLSFFFLFFFPDERTTSRSIATLAYPTPNHVSRTDSTHLTPPAGSGR